MQRVLIAGGTGFVGKNLIPFLLKKGFNLSVLTRKDTHSPDGNLKFYKWDIDKGKIDVAALKDVDTIINLTGANIGEKRWTKRRKEVITDSRVNAVNLLYKYAVENKIAIKTFISSSAVGYYGAVTSAEIFKENSGSGTDFLSEVCREWEAATQQFSAINSRVIQLRKRIIIGNDGVYKRMSALAKYGINPGLGTGKQYVPWIAIDDLLNIYHFFLTHPDIHGCFNTVATEHITMNDFASKLLRSFGKKSFSPNVPSFIIKLLFGEMAAMLLEGSRVSNEKIKKAGFEFEYDSVADSFLKLNM